jgi:hypothetical protein
MNEDWDYGQNLTLRACGEFLGNRWEFRGDIIGDSEHHWISYLGPDYYTEGGGAGGALPFAADIGWKTSGHIGACGGSGGWERKWLWRIPKPGFINGVVSRKVAKVVVFFKNQTPEEALIIESGHPDVQFFLLPYLPKIHWIEMVVLDVVFLPDNPRIHWIEIVALDTEGCELDRAKVPQ